ncbi:probable E3 ubiquitin-protein ligase BRE1 [Coccomyxa sp. Obi]|nr:probable E3 ubiquitin-protein ligase BRE1 [Coccomyxa sp. Obi]
MLWPCDKRPSTTSSDEKKPSFTSAQPAVAPRGTDALSTDEQLCVIKQLVILQREKQQEYDQARKAYLNHMQAVAMSAMKEVEALREASRCRICLTADVDAALTACGHMLCLNCSSGCHQRCPFCRRHPPIIRLYK